MKVPGSVEEKHFCPVEMALPGKASGFWDSLGNLLILLYDIEEILHRHAQRNWCEGGPKLYQQRVVTLHHTV